MKDIDTFVDFYTSAMGMDKVVFGQGRIALSLGGKINLHQLGNEIDPKTIGVQSGRDPDGNLIGGVSNYEIM